MCTLWLCLAASGVATGWPLQEAAWASFALLRNSNICGLVALWEGRAVMCRGLVGLPAGATGNADAVLQAVTQVGGQVHRAYQQGVHPSLRKQAAAGHLQSWREGLAGHAAARRTRET